MRNENEIDNLPPTIELMRAHRSIRDFKSDPVPDEMIETIIEAAQWASTSSFRQMYSVVAVKDPVKKQELYKLCARQRWIFECPIFLSFCADLNRLDDVCGIKNRRASMQYAESFLMAALDAGLFMQNAALASEAMGLGMVMIGGLRDYPGKIASLLELPQGVFGISGMCVGYPARLPEQRPRLPLDEVLYWESYQKGGRSQRLETYDKAIKSANTYKRKDGTRRGWSDVMAVNAAKPPASGERTRFIENLRQRGFGME